jgi:hypothetical protein
VGAREREEVQPRVVVAGRRSPGRLLDAALRPRSELSTSGWIGSESDSLHGQFSIFGRLLVAQPEQQTDDKKKKGKLRPEILGKEGYKD